MKLYQKGVHGSIPVPISDRFWEKVRSLDDDANDLPGCWEWQGFYNAVSGKPEMNTESSTIEGIPRSTSTKAYRVAWVLHYDPIPPGHSVYRACGNIRCVRYDHLRLKAKGQPFERFSDAPTRYRNGRRLNVAGARRIREAVSSSRRPDGRVEYGIYQRLAAELGVSPETVTDVARGKTWRTA